MFNKETKERIELLEVKIEQVNELTKRVMIIEEQLRILDEKLNPKTF